MTLKDTFLLRLLTHSAHYKYRCNMSYKINVIEIYNYYINSRLWLVNVCQQLLGGRRKAIAKKCYRKQV